MLGHQPKIKKLSTAINHGIKMADERGIKPSTGKLFGTDREGNITCACSLGMGIIGKYGMEAAKEVVEDFQDGYEMLSQDLNTEVPNLCLVETANKKVPSAHLDGECDIDTIVITLNDSYKMKPQKVVELLKECKL